MNLVEQKLYQGCNVCEKNSIKHDKYPLFRSQKNSLSQNLLLPLRVSKKDRVVYSIAHQGEVSGCLGNIASRIFFIRNALVSHDLSSPSSLSFLHLRNISLSISPSSNPHIPKTCILCSVLCLFHEAACTSQLCITPASARTTSTILGA